MHESKHQEALIKWFDYVYPKLSALLWHTPNGGTRNKLEAYRLKLQGVRAGIPDLFLAVPRGTFFGLFIELKSEKGKLTMAQEIYLSKLNERGYKAMCCYGWHQASDAIKDYLNDEPN